MTMEVLKMERIIKCKTCGCDVVAKSNHKRYCEQCLKDKEKAYRQSYGKQWKSVEKQAKKKLIKPSKPKLSIYEVANLASKAGMSYGQYVSKLEGKR